ncbi:MAG: hypothetical protein WC162_08235 [Sphaerochaetaceae bacterium]|nr:hypothetical protein [Sphaerochaetaceae bacterium]
MVIKPFFTSENSKTSYLICDELTHQAILINIFEIDISLINCLENYKLKTLYITDRQGYSIIGLKTLFKIYQPQIMTPEKNKTEYIGKTPIYSIPLSNNELLIKIEDKIFSGCVEYDKFFSNEKNQLFVYPANNPVTTIETISNLKLLNPEL